MLEKLTVRVSRERIRDGERCRSRRCPVALAVQAADASIEYASAGARELLIRRTDGRWYLLPLPPSVVDWMTWFDRGVPSMQPFQFTLRYDASVSLAEAIATLTAKDAKDRAVAAWGPSARG